MDARSLHQTISNHIYVTVKVKIFYSFLLIEQHRTYQKSLPKLTIITIWNPLINLAKLGLPLIIIGT